MKKLAIISIWLLFAFSVKAQYQTTERENRREPGEEDEMLPLKRPGGNTVNETAKENFNIDFAKADVSDLEWKTTDTYDEAIFNSNGKQMIAYYDYQGNLIGTTTTVSFEDLPQHSQKLIKEKYGDYTIGPIIFFDDNDKIESEMILWSKKFNDEDLYFVDLRKETGSKGRG